MTIDKAIKSCTAYLKNGKIPKSSDGYNATLLSIEALKQELRNRLSFPKVPIRILPGETRD